MGGFFFRDLAFWLSFSDEEVGSCALWGSEGSIVGRSLGTHAMVSKGLLFPDGKEWPAMVSEGLLFPDREERTAEQ